MTRYTPRHASGRSASPLRLRHYHAQHALRGGWRRAPSYAVTLTALVATALLPSWAPPGSQPEVRARSAPAPLAEAALAQVPGPPAVPADPAVPAPGPESVTAAVPGQLVVEAIGLAVPVVPVGLAEDGTLRVPEEPGVSGWWAGGSAPGEHGPAVLVGHVGTVVGAGVFARLAELRPGDRVTVRGIDARTTDFVVQRVEQHDKDAFPTAAVYGPTAGPELRLVTCGGAFDRRARSYRDNVVVFAAPA